MSVAFNKPYLTQKELNYMTEAAAKGCLSGNGDFTKSCHRWLEEQIGCFKALLTHSCTAALEMTAILADLQPGDEVIMPSYTFVSTANAFVLRGAVPVFVDIRQDTLNIDETKIEKAISHRTRAIVPVHYAGVACEMDTIMEIATKYNLLVIEDAAQGLMSTYNGKPLGSMGHMAALSFHETKNIISGEGGALLINDPCFIERAEIIWEKGTNRSKFFRGQVDKYSWVDIGSSYLPSEITAAFLWAQMEEAGNITEKRKVIWDTYNLAFEEMERQELIRRPVIPPNCRHNAHLYYLLLNNLEQRTEFINWFSKENIEAVFHYIPLHSSPAGLKYGRVNGCLPKTDKISDTIVRLPLWVGMSDSELEKVINSSRDFFQRII